MQDTSASQSLRWFGGTETEGQDVFRTTELQPLSSIFHHEITIKGRNPICVQEAELSADPPELWHTGSYTSLLFKIMSKWLLTVTPQAFHSTMCTVNFLPTRQCMQILCSENEVAAA